MQEPFETANTRFGPGSSSEPGVTGSQDETTLMQRTARGDPAAFRALAELHLGKIMNFAYRMLHDRTEAEDVAQETFLRLWKDAGRYEPRARVGTWLHRIAHNLCIDRLRRSREEPSEDLDDERCSEEPGGLLDRKREASAVERALASLPERQRAAITLVHYQGLGNIEAAAIMDIGVEALESLLSRGRRTLRTLLAEVAVQGGRS